MGKKTIRRTFSLPPAIDENLTYIAGRMGISKSALVVKLMDEPIQDLAALVRLVPDNPTGDDVKRLRGESENVITQRFEDLRHLQNDLFRE